MEAVTLNSEELGLLLGAVNADACLLYLYGRASGVWTADPAARALGLERARADRALGLLGQLGLLPQPENPPPQKETPDYTEQDVTGFLRRDGQFSLLVGEAQRRLGKVLSTESLKTLLAIYDYLGLPTEVIGILIGYCIQRAQLRGNSNPPTMRAIEKEASQWAQRGIDTIASAAEYVQLQQERLTLFGRFRQALGLGGKLSGAEERYLQSWVEMGFEVSAIELAYERTRLNTGTLKWTYMNKILADWHDQGLHTAAQAAAEPRRNGKQANGGSASLPADSRDRDIDFEREALERLQRRGRYGREE